MPTSLATIIVAGQQYRPAMWPRRIAARLIDVGLIIIVSTAGGSTLALLTTPLSIAYLFVGNGLLRGASLGKRLTGLKIIDATHGRPCTVIQDLLRHRYLLFFNPLYAVLHAYDSSKGCFDKPEIHLVEAEPLTATERETLQNEQREKPAKLDLAGMQATLQALREKKKNNEPHSRS